MSDAAPRDVGDRPKLVRLRTRPLCSYGVLGAEVATSPGALNCLIPRLILRSSRSSVRICASNVALLDEVLRVAQVLAPAHFRNVDQAFYARHDFTSLG